jgi:two-component system sensor histidine kinase AlgZ
LERRERRHAPCEFSEKDLKNPQVLPPSGDMASINQNGGAVALPNFRNLGVMLRVLVMANAMALAAALVRAPTLDMTGRQLVEISSLFQPILLLTLLALMALSPLLQKMSYLNGICAVLALPVLTTTVVWQYGSTLMGGREGLLRALIVAVGASALIVTYFNLRSRLLSPALTIARLQALQARIRPHFLFNSLNAVLSLIRAEPRRAEAALEDLADLFRVLMQDNRELAPLSREVALCRQYLDLEQLRLGERLQVEWNMEDMPHDALMPPLVLQPIIENAVYHGIEPAIEPGTVSINICRRGKALHAVVTNPVRKQGRHHSGNKMAMANIRERLALHFDAEASITNTATESTYNVHIVIPYVTAAAR